jgi:hypothetical protein
LYENKEGPASDELKDIKTYCEQVTVDYYIHPFVYWEVENNLSYDENKKLWLSNEVFVIFNNEIILSHKKGLYYKEAMSDLMKKYNYYYGMGNNIIHTKKEENLKFAQLIDKYFYIGICKEATDELEYIKQFFINFDSSILVNNLKIIVEQKKELFKKLTQFFYSQKKYFIIISNSTSLKDIMHTFPEDGYVIQCDPKCCQVFKIKYNHNFLLKKKELNFNITNLNEIDFLEFKEIIGNNIFNIIKIKKSVNVTIEDIYQINMYNID